MMTDSEFVARLNRSYEYVTLAESFRRNARRHEARANYYLIIGRIGWACGSARKALKNWRKAAYLEQWDI